MDEEMLISLVERHPELYNPEDPKYHDDVRRVIVWEQIGTYMVETSTDCRRKWKKIRENYRKAILLRKAKSEQGIKYTKPIRHSALLGFMTPFIQNEFIDPLDINPALKSDDEYSNESLNKPRQLKAEFFKKRKAEKDQEKPEQERLVPEHPAKRSRDDDTTVNFFKNLGETMKAFPPELRIRVKRAVFNIVSEAEEESIDKNTTQ